MTATVDHVRLKRNRIIAAIKAAERQLGMDQDAHRQLVKSLAGGRESLTQCDMGYLLAILDHLNRRTGNGKAEHEGRRRSTPSPDRAPLVAKVDALLAELHRVTGRVHTLAYADAICKRNKWAECVDFADPRALTNLVGALTRTLQYKQGARHG